MQPTDPARRPQSRHPSPLPAVPFADGDPRLGVDLGAPETYTPLRLDAPALLVEARFRDVPLASRLLRADLPGAFTIGAARGADAPVNPAWLPSPTAALEPPAHRLVERVEAGFVVNLTPAMRAELRTPVQRLALPPDHGHAEAPLALPRDATLRIPCGEVIFELHAAEPAPTLPRPWLPARWRDGVGYPLAVMLALAVLVAVAQFVPSDPRALSLDALGADHRLDRFFSIPLDVNALSIEKQLGLPQSGGSGGPAAAKPEGAAGDRRAPRADRRLAYKGQPSPVDAREAAARIRSNPMLALLDGPRASELADVMAAGPAMGSDVKDAMGHLTGTMIGDAYNVGGLGVVGTGEGGGGTHEGTMAGMGLGTLGRLGAGRGGPGGYGTGVGTLGRRVPRVPDIFSTIGSVRGNLDKEIIRRIVRRHVNEVRYCYEQALAARPALEGRLVVQFTIAPTGRVLAALLSSSSLGAPAVESCVVSAVKRWEFPEPVGGGLVIVSYPFQLAPAGG